MRPPPSPDQDRLLTHLRALIGERHPITSPAALQRAEAYLAESFDQLGLQVSTHPFHAMGATYRNVIASFPATHAGNGAPMAPLILAAHYDTVEGSPGADDNASGLVTMLEAAHRLRRLDRSREIQFIGFCLEEENLLGSMAYAAQLKASGQAIHGAIVLESVGYASSQEGSQAIPSGTPIHVPTVGNFLAVIGNEPSATLTASVEQAAMPHVPVISLTVPGNGELLPDTRRSDHAAFWHYGFPAVMVTDTANFRNPHYHQPTDTLETLDLKFLGQVLEAMIAVATNLTKR